MRLSLALICLFVLSGIAIIAESDDAQYYYVEGERLLKNGSCSEAMASFESSIAEDPIYWDAWYGKGLALYCLEEYEEGLELCDHVLGNPQSSQGAGLDKFIVLDGNFYEAYEDKYNQPPISDPDRNLCSGEIPDNYRIAIERYEEALRLNPNSTHALNSKGIILGSVGCFNQSIECFDKVLDLNSSHAEVWNNIGVSLDWSERDAESLGYYNQAIDLNPNLAVAWMNRAKKLSDMSYYSMARENASRAFELDPSLKNESSLWTWKYIYIF
ncbi:MAG: tetratricopeptide repeat protein [Methanothrix sp.]